MFEPFEPSLLEYTNRASNRPFGSQNARLTATYLLHAWTLSTQMASRTLVCKVVRYERSSSIDTVGPDIQLDNIQITLPDEQDLYLDTFCATGKTPPSLSKPGEGDNPIVARRRSRSGF